MKKYLVVQKISRFFAPEFDDAKVNSDVKMGGSLFSDHNKDSIRLLSPQVAAQKRQLTFAKIQAQRSFFNVITNFLPE